MCLCANVHGTSLALALAPHKFVAAQTYPISVSKLYGMAKHTQPERMSVDAICTRHQPTLS